MVNLQKLKKIKQSLELVYGYTSKIGPAWATQEQVMAENILQRTDYQQVKQITKDMVTFDL